MVSCPPALPLAGSRPLPAGLRGPLSPALFPRRRSLQQVLLLCTGIMVMVLFSAFVE